MAVFSRLIVWKVGDNSPARVVSDPKIIRL